MLDGTKENEITHRKREILAKEQLLSKPPATQLPPTKSIAKNFAC